MHTSLASGALRSKPAFQKLSSRLPRHALGPAKKRSGPWVRRFFGCIWPRRILQHGSHHPSTRAISSLQGKTSAWAGPDTMARWA